MRYLRNRRRRGGGERPFTWSVFNQTHTAPHQRLFERLSRDLGPCGLLTGTPFPVEESLLTVISGPAYQRGSFPRRIRSWLLFTMRALWVGARLPRGTLLIAATNPPLLPAVAWLLSRVRGLRYVLLIWDVYPNLLVATRLVRDDHVIVRAWRWMNVRVMARASRVVTLGEVMVRQVEKQFPDSGAAGVEIIPNWGQTEEIKPVAKAANSFARRHNQLDKITVLYAGNIGSAHGVERIVWLADTMRDDDRFSFLIVGDGLGLPKVVGEVSRLGVDNLRVLPPQPWKAVPDMLAAAEIAVVLQEKGTEALSMPSKVYSSMAAGSAILALTAPISDLAHVVLDHGIGMVCDQDDIARAASVLRSLASDSTKLDEVRRRSRQTAVTVFSEETIYKQWLGCLTGLVKPQPGDRRG